MTAPQDREMARINDIERRLYALDGELSPVPPKPTLDRCQCYSSMHDACFYELFGATRHAPAPAAPERTSAGLRRCPQCHWPSIMLTTNPHETLCYACMNKQPAAPASSKGEKPMSDEEIGNRLIQRFKGLNPQWAQDYQARDLGHFARELFVPRGTSRDYTEVVRLSTENAALLAERNALAQENVKLKRQVDDARRRFDDIAEGCRAAIEGAKQC